MRDPRTPDCGIKGCTRAASRGLLCTRHRALVPWTERMAPALEAMTFAHRNAKKHHRAQVRAVQQMVNEGTEA